MMIRRCRLERAFSKALASSAAASILLIFIFMLAYIRKCAYIVKAAEQSLARLAAPAGPGNEDMFQPINQEVHRERRSRSSHPSRHHGTAQPRSCMAGQPLLAAAHCLCRGKSVPGRFYRFLPGCHHLPETGPEDRFRVRLPAGHALTALRCFRYGGGCACKA